MGYLGFTIDEDIIKENKDKMTEKRMEDMIHEALKSGGSITQSEGHDQELIVALMSSKVVLGMLTYMVVARMKIEFSKELGTT